MKKKIIIISAFIFFLDQLIKLLISSFLHLNESLTIITNIFNITYLENSGAAWSILNGHLSLLIVFSVIALFIIIYYMKKFVLNKRNIIAFGLIYGGLLGNLFDRLFHGYVIDYFDFKIFNYKYPVFNIADTALVIGIFLIIIAIFKGEDQNGNTSK